MQEGGGVSSFTMDYELEAERYYFRHATIEAFVRRHVAQYHDEWEYVRRRQTVEACIRRQLEKIFEQDRYWEDRNEGRLRSEDFEQLGEFLTQ